MRTGAGRDRMSAFGSYLSSGCIKTMKMKQKKMIWRHNMPGRYGRDCLSASFLISLRCIDIPCAVQYNSYIPFTERRRVMKRLTSLILTVFSFCPALLCRRKFRCLTAIRFLETRQFLRHRISAYWAISRFIIFFVIKIDNWCGMKYVYADER